MTFRPGRFDSNLIKVNNRFEKRRHNQQRTRINKESKEKGQRERQVWQALLVPGRESQAEQSRCAQSQGGDGGCTSDRASGH